MAGLSPEFYSYVPRGFGWYLDVAKRMTRLGVWLSKEGMLRVVEDRSPEQLLRRTAKGVHRHVVLEHERTNESVR